MGRCGSRGKAGFYATASGAGRQASGERQGRWMTARMWGSAVVFRAHARQVAGLRRLPQRV